MKGKEKREKGKVPARKAINVGLLGIGTVGGGAFAVLARNQEEIARRAGCAITMKKAMPAPVPKSTVAPMRCNHRRRMVASIIAPAPKRRR